MAPRKKFLLRIQPELWAELQRWAGAEFRSVNGQIEFLLKRAVEQRRRPQPPSEDSGDGEGEPRVE